MLSASLIYFYLSDLGEGSNYSIYYQRLQQWWGNNHEMDPIKVPAQSKCVVTPNIYSQKELKRIYNYVDHKPCKLFTNDTITFKDDHVTVKCINNKFKPLFAYDLNSVEIYGGSAKEKVKWKSKVATLAGKQFVFVKCSYSAVYAYVFNWFNQKASDSANVIRMSLGYNKRPMSVLLLVLDSVSRYSFQRNLPKTNDFLNKLEKSKEFKEDFTVFEFEKSATPMAFTKYNMAQIIFGKSVEEIEEVVGSNVKFLKHNKDIYLKHQEENAIWKHFSSLGYVTMFSHDTSFDYVSALTGRYIQADHVLTNFWRYLWGVIGMSDLDDGRKCIGTKDMHEFSFDYAYQFFGNYPNNNKFAQVHIDAAHENTGNVRTVDEDLLKFLIQYLRLIKSRNENLAIVLMSDHGHKKIKLGSQWDKRSFYEFHTPFTYLIATKDVIKSLNAYENLKHNKVQLLSRYDINLSLKHLAYFPYNVSLDTWYPQAKEYYTYNNTVSLFEEKVSVDRTCEDIGVEREYCLCSSYEPVDDNEVETKIQKKMIKLFTKYLRFEGEFNRNSTVDERIESIRTFSFPLRKIERGLDTLYKMEIKTRTQVEITIHFNFCRKKRILKTEEILPKRNHPYSFFRVGGLKAFLQLRSIKIPSQCLENFLEC